MSSDRALLLSVAAFVVFSVFILVLFAALDVEPIFSIGPIIAVGIASVGVYRAARDDAS